MARCRQNMPKPMSSSLFITAANDYNTMLHFVCHHYWPVVLAILKFRHDDFFPSALIAMRSL